MHPSTSETSSLSLQLVVALIAPKRTGHSKLLFGDDLGRQGGRSTDPTCYQAKVQAHVAQTIAAKPELVQIRTAYGSQKEGSPVLHATSTPPFGTISQSQRMRRSGLNSKCASSPPTPSSPRVAMLVASTRSAQTHHARFIIPSSKPAATMRRRRQNTRSSARKRPSPTLSLAYRSE
jgi:hypothetical protein